LAFEKKQFRNHRNPTSAWSGLARESPLFIVAWASRSSATLDAWKFE